MTLLSVTEEQLPRIPEMTGHNYGVEALIVCGITQLVGVLAIVLDANFCLLADLVLIGAIWLTSTLCFLPNFGTILSSTPKLGSKCIRKFSTIVSHSTEHRPQERASAQDCDNHVPASSPPCCQVILANITHLRALAHDRGSSALFWALAL